MNSKIYRILLYFLLCIPLRSFIIYLAYKKNKYIPFIILIAGILFTLKYFNNNINDLGAFGGKVWWNDLRLFHGIMYILYFLLQYFEINNAYIILIIDIIIGIISFITI